jgi:uncharacterized protein (TIGR00255 family)
MSAQNALQSMTGFGSAQERLMPSGSLHVELRSINHKALEIMIHLPVGFLSLEAQIKKAIEDKVKRGRITCAVSLSNGESNRVSLNKGLLKDYVNALKEIKREFGLRAEPSAESMLHLPGVVSLSENKIYTRKIKATLRRVLGEAIDEMVSSRRKEGEALFTFLHSRAVQIERQLLAIKGRFKRAINTHLSSIKIDEERVSFLKDTDITEEIERLQFHIRNFKTKLRTTGPIGKELDFIAQEMQREANTMTAKSFDMEVSEKVIQVKSQIEKIREQLQNVE